MLGRCLRKARINNFDACEGLVGGRTWAVSAEVLAAVPAIGTGGAAGVARAAGGSEEERAAGLFSTGGEAVGENSLTRLVDIEQPRLQTPLKAENTPVAYTSLSGQKIRKRLRNSSMTQQSNT